MLKAQESAIEFVFSDFINGKIPVTLVGEYIRELHLTKRDLADLSLRLPPANEVSEEQAPRVKELEGILKLAEQYAPVVV